jgi:hypothetical protein
MTHPSSGSKNKPRKKSADYSASGLLRAGLFIALSFDAEDGGDMILRNVG